MEELFGSVQGVEPLANDQNGAGNVFPSTTSKELETLNKELRDLNQEKLKLEGEVNQDEATMRLKQSETKSLQNETETLHQMIKQLDTQKGEARKRLDDLGVQNTRLKLELSEISSEIEEKKSQVQNLKGQFEEQKVVVGSQETEMLTKKRELDQLRSEESQLQNQLGTFRHDVDSLSQNLGQTQLQISQVKTRLLHLEEYERRLTEGLSDLDAAINNNDYHKLNSLLVRPVTPPPELAQTTKTGFLEADSNEKDFPSLTNEFTADPFAGEDPFSGEGGGGFAVDGFDDPFASTGPTGGFDQNNDMFDPFNALSMPAKPNVDNSFGSDPFAAGSESPVPELPPKKGKGGPPPRPNAPKGNSGGPSRNVDPAKPADPWAAGFDTAPNPQDAFDPFGSAAVGGGSGFADFADFDKVEMPPPIDPYATLDSIARQSALMNKRTHSAFEPARSNNSSPWEGFDTLWTGSSSANPTPMPTSAAQATFSPFSAFDADEKMRRALQEQADYELALKLSKADQKSQKPSANAWRWN